MQFIVKQHTASSMRGVMQAVTAGWFAQGVFTLWLAPLALAAAYYVVPKVTGRVLPAYQSASLAFWVLIVVGAWTGGRHLIGGPVPAWIPSLAIVSCSLLVFHYFVVWMNLKGALGQGGAVMKLTSFGLLAYVIGGCADALTSIRGFAVITQFTYFTQAQQQLALYGGVSMLFFGALYFAHRWSRDHGDLRGFNARDQPRRGGLDARPGAPQTGGHVPGNRSGNPALVTLGFGRVHRAFAR